MEPLNIADAKARFSEIIERVEAGETVEVMRRGRLVARVTPASPPKQRVDPALLAAARGNSPRQTQSAGDFIREMRDTDRY